MTEIQKRDDEKPVIVDLGETMTGLGNGTTCNYGTSATNVCMAGGTVNS